MIARRRFWAAHSGFKALTPTVIRLAPPHIQECVAAAQAARHIRVMWKQFAAVVGLTLALAASPATPAFADEPTVGQKLDQAVERALSMIKRFMAVVPGYEAPEITPEGDIIIRKIRPDAPAPNSDAEQKPLPDGQRRT